MLDARRIAPLFGCLTAPTLFSTPYTVRVRVHEDFDDTSALTERKMMVVLGDECDTDGMRSGIFNVRSVWQFLM